MAPPSLVFLWTAATVSAMMAGMGPAIFSESRYFTPSADALSPSGYAANVTVRRGKYFWGYTPKARRPANVGRSTPPPSLAAILKLIAASSSSRFANTLGWSDFCRRITPSSRPLSRSAIVASATILASYDGCVLSSSNLSIS